MTELLIKPAGHGAQEVREYKQDQSGFDAFMRAVRKSTQMTWDDYSTHDDHYAFTKYHMRGLRFSSEEVNSFIVHPSCDDERLASCIGMVSSVLYNNACEPLVITDFHRAVHTIGFGFEGVLVNRGTVGLWYGKKATGIIINIGKTRGSISSDNNYLPSNSTGMCITTDPQSIAPRPYIEPGGLMVKAWGKYAIHYNDGTRNYWKQRHNRKGLSTGRFTRFIDDLLDKARNDPQAILGLGTPAEIKQQALELAKVKL